MKILIGSDFKSSDYKNQLKEYLVKQGFEILDKTEGQELDFFQASKLVTEGMINEEGQKEAITVINKLIN